MCIKSMPHFCNYFGTSCDRCVLSTCGPVAPVAMGKASGAGDVLKKKGGIMKKPSQGTAAKSSPEYAAKSMPKKSSKPQKLLVSKAASFPMNLAKGDNKGAASKGKGAEAFSEEGLSEGKGVLGKGDPKRERPSKTKWRVYQNTGVKMSLNLQRQLREDQKPASEDWHTYGCDGLWFRGIRIFRLHSGRAITYANYWVRDVYIHCCVCMIRRGCHCARDRRPA